MTQSNPSPNSFMQQNERKASRTQSPEEKVPVVECFDGLARITSKELASTHSVKSGTLLNACSTRRRVVADLVKSARMHMSQVDEQPGKKSKKRMMTRVQQPRWRRMIGTKMYGNLLSNVTSHERSGQPDLNRDTHHELKTRTYWLSIIKRTTFGLRLSRHEAAEVYSTEDLRHAETNPTCACHTKIRDQNLSLGYICPGEPRQRSPNAPKFEDRSQEETEWKEQGVREAARKLAKSVFKLKEQEKATFFSPSENRCLPASTLKLEEREFVVGSGPSMHMISKKDLSNAELDTLTKSCSPRIVMTANGEVQTHEEATVFVKELDIFLTMKVLENTPAVLSLGKLCDENGYSFEWINGQKPHLIKNGIRISFNTEKFVPIVVPGLSNSSSGSDSPTSRTLSRQGSHYSTSSSSSSSSLTVSEIQTREREDRIESDISPVTVSTTVDERSGRPDIDQANENPKTNKKEPKREQGDPLFTDSGRERSEIPE